MNNAGPNETQMTAGEQPSQANLHLEMAMDDEKNPKAPTPVPSQSKKGGRCCCIVSVLAFLLVVGVAAAVIFLVVLAPPGMKPLETDDYDIQVDKETKDITLMPKEGVEHKYSLIWLHGLGKNVRDEFEYFAEQEEGERVASLNTKILIPQAPKMKLTRQPPPKPMGKGKDGDDEDEKDGPGGKRGGEGKGRGGRPGMMQGKDGMWNAWFDMLEGDKPGAEKTEADWQSRYDQDGLVAASDKILAMIEAETAALGGDASKVFVGGFSQGGVLSLAVYLRYDFKDNKRLGGVFSLSGMQGLAKGKYTYSGTSPKATKTITALRGTTPLFTYYGKEDKGFKGAEVTFKQFKDKVYKSSKYKKNWSRNDVADQGHEITKEEWEALAKWIGPLQGM